MSRCKPSIPQRAYYIYIWAFLNNNKYIQYIIYSLQIGIIYAALHELTSHEHKYCIFPPPPFRLTSCYMPNRVVVCYERKRETNEHRDCLGLEVTDHWPAHLGPVLNATGNPHGCVVGQYTELKRVKDQEREVEKKEQVFSRGNWERKGLLLLCCAMQHC